MKLVEGVYESLISTAIAEKLQRDFPESGYHVEKEQIDSAESHTMLAQYLAEIVSVVLKEYFRDKKEAVTISKQVECVNRILHFIENELELLLVILKVSLFLIICKSIALIRIILILFSLLF